MSETLRDMLDAARHWLALSLIQLALAIMPLDGKKARWLLAAQEALS